MSDDSGNVVYRPVSQVVVDRFEFRVRCEWDRVVSDDEAREIQKALMAAVPRDGTVLVGSWLRRLS